jgi:porphobilinogen synthase
MSTLDITKDPFILDMPKRPRRNRKSDAIRSLIKETRLHPNHLIAPLFVIEGSNIKQDIASMPNVCRLSIDLLLREIEDLYKLGIRAVELFAYNPTEMKDKWGSEAIRPNNLMQRALSSIKKHIPEMCLMIDIALDPYTDHGHDGWVNDDGEILNDPTLEVLGKMAVLAAEAGADVVAPSDMMDGRVAHIRKALDQAGHIDVSILAYAAKYASSLYGPFRDALDSAPKFGDKQSYQLNPANTREALLECRLDEEEGADLLLIKPALVYLDIIAKVREQTQLPIGGYFVSGEYSMIMAAAQKGWLDEKKAMTECHMAIKRAGADFILTYAAKSLAQSLKD